MSDIQKTCTVSGQIFLISESDQRFYEKIRVDIPNLSPVERLRRRMSWRNDRVFYKRKSDYNGKDIVSMYPENSKFVIYHQSEWWSDSWNPMDYCGDFDFTRTFF